ncbi:hypothetical protein HUU61_15220 [Rhodopseudomonas palustris]|nr:hypothetical protein [Rhodopseudomonas palustris]
MHGRTLRLLFAASIAGCLLVSSVDPGLAANVIITEEEGKLPPPREMPAPSDRGITRGPKIELDADDKVVLRAPLHLKLKFKTYGGSAIDLGALQATYIKEPAVDLTTRLKPFAQQTGIDIPDAQLPPGEHFIQILIKDSDGRAVTKVFKLKVAP